MRTSEVLNEAADQIERRGWATGAGWQISDGPTLGTSVCLEGAMQLALGIPAVPEHLASEMSQEINLCAAGRALHDYLGEAAPSSWLFMWNDSQSSAEPVIEVLRAAAVIEEAREEQAEAEATYAANVAAAADLAAMGWTA